MYVASIDLEIFLSGNKVPSNESTPRQEGPSAKPLLTLEVSHSCPRSAGAAIELLVLYQHHLSTVLESQRCLFEFINHDSCVTQMPT